MRIRGTYPRCAYFCRKKTFLSPQGRGQSWSLPSFPLPRPRWRAPDTPLLAPSPFSSRKEEEKGSPATVAPSKQSRRQLCSWEGGQQRTGRSYWQVSCRAGLSCSLMTLLEAKATAGLKSRRLHGQDLLSTEVHHVLIHSFMHLFIQWTLNWEHTIPGAIPQPVARFSLLDYLAESSIFLRF